MMHEEHTFHKSLFISTAEIHKRTVKKLVLKLQAADNQRELILLQI